MCVCVCVCERERERERERESENFVVLATLDDDDDDDDDRYVLPWTPIYGRAKAGRPAATYIQQLCEDTGCSPEDLPEAMNDREKWRERVRDIRASGTT